MSVSSMTINWDALSSLTRDKFLPVLVDNIFNSNPLAVKLLKNAEMLDGGRKIITPLEYAKNTAQGFYSGYDVLDTTPSDPVTSAVWDWKQAYANISISGEEELKNSGDSMVLSLLKSKMGNAERSLKDLFGTKLFGSGTAAPGSNEITALCGQGVVDNSTDEASESAVIDYPGASVMHAGGNIDNCIIGYNRSLGGINSDSYTWWESKFASFANDKTDLTDAAEWDELTATTNGVSKIVARMTRMYGALTIGSDQPDLIICPQNLYDAYETGLQGNKRFVGTDAGLADAGFSTLKFKGADVVADSHCPDGVMLFLNTKYLDFKTHSKRNFSFQDFQKPINQDARTAKIFWMGQLVCTNPRMQGMIVAGPSGY
jgi:hypothetical protein